MGKLCGSQRSPANGPESPLRGKNRRQLGDVSELDSSHVRFQDSDLDEIEQPQQSKDLMVNNNNNKMTNIQEEPEEDSEDVYSKVYEAQATIHHRDLAPRPAVRRKKRKELDERYRQGRGPSHSTDAHVSFDWLSGAHHGQADQANSQVAVLKNMVYKLSVELGKEQAKVRNTGVQLDQVQDAPWLSQVGGLVPLLVAYEEEVKDLKQSKQELEEVVGKNKERLEELLQDNTEMATQLHNISKVGPIDFEEYRVIRESAALVLEENSLLKESNDEVSSRFEKFQDDSHYRLSIAEQDILSLRQENKRLLATNKKLEEEAKHYHDLEMKMKTEMSNCVHIDTHSKAVGECQKAFEQLKENYTKDSEEKTENIKQLKNELSEANVNLEKLKSSNLELDSELKISNKMMSKYEELCLALQDKLLVLAKNRAEAEEFARKCEEEADMVKMEAEALAKLARQHRAAEKAAERERGLESVFLEKLQQRMMELKVSMGGQIKQLELEVKKSEASKVLLKERLELELQKTKRELELQKKITDKLKMKMDNL